MLTFLVVSCQFHTPPEVQVKDASPDPHPGLCCPRDKAETGSSGGVSQIEITTKKR